MTNKPKRDLYREISETLAQKIEAGARPWVCPWEASSFGIRPLRANGERYRGINVLMLWAAASLRGFENPHWMTFKQAQQLGAKVMKGAKSEQVVYVGRVERETGEIDPETGAPLKAGASFLKAYRVFNVAEIAGLPEKYTPEPRTSHAWEREPEAETFFDAIPAKVQHQGASAFYRPSDDSITLPPRDAFKSAAGYYSTRAHEVAHWTGAPHRLNRQKGNRFGDPRYAFEELVAEIAAAFTMANLGTALEPQENTVAYLANWAECLRAEPRAIFRAATLAEEAADFMEKSAGRQKQLDAA